MGAGRGRWHQRRRGDRRRVPAEPHRFRADRSMAHRARGPGADRARLPCVGLPAAAWHRRGDARAGLSASRRLPGYQHHAAAKARGGRRGRHCDRCARCAADRQRQGRAGQRAGGWNARMDPRHLHRAARRALGDFELQRRELR